MDKATAHSPRLRALLLGVVAAFALGIVPMLFTTHLTPVVRDGLWACFCAAMCVVTWAMPMSRWRGLGRVIWVVALVLAVALTILRVVR